MDVKELPDNVKSNKQKQPKGWSYPIKTMEVVEMLDLGSFEHNVHLYFDNSPPREKEWRGQEDNSFDVLSLWHSAGNNLYPEEYYSISVRLCKPKYRKKLLEIIKNDIFPIMKKWIRAERVYEGLTLRYRQHHWQQGSHKVFPALVLGKGRIGEGEVFVKEIDLDEEIA